MKNTWFFPQYSAPKLHSTLFLWTFLCIDTHSTAECKTGFRLDLLCLDLLHGQLNSNKMFKKVLFELNKIGPVLISQILCFNFSDWSQYLQYVQSYLEIFICHLAATVPLLETHNTSPVSRYFVDSEIWPVLMAWIRKNSVLLAAFQRAVMVHWLHSARHITLLLASFDVTLPIEREKPSWIDRTIGISPSTRWGLLSEFPALRLRFRVSHHAIY